MKIVPSGTRVTESGIHGPAARAISICLIRASVAESVGAFECVSNKQKKNQKDKRLKKMRKIPLHCSSNNANNAGTYMRHVHFVENL